MSAIKEDKKRGTYYFVVEGNRNPITGKRKQIKRTGFETKKEAELAMAQILVDVSNGDLTDPTTMTFENYMDEWMEDKKLTVEESTFDLYTKHYKNHIQPMLGHIKLQDLDHNIMQKFVKELNNQNLAPTTIGTIFKLANFALKKAKRRKLIKELPTEEVTLPRIEKTEIQVWTVEELNRFLQESKSIKRLTRNYTGIVIACFSGMRMGEILGLRWKDIDFENKLIYVKQTLSIDGKRLRPYGKKESSLRTISIPNVLVTELLSHKERIQAEKERYSDYDDNDLVICTMKGNRVHPRSFRKSFWELTQKIEGLPIIRFHDLRHTHATILIKQNVNVKIIQERLGHNDIETTLNTYSHVLPSMQQVASNELDNLFT